MSASHGQILSNTDKRTNAIRLYNAGAGRDKEYIQNKLSVSSRMVNKYLSDIDKQIKEARKAKIMQMYLACHTEVEIAEAVGLERPRVNEILALLPVLEPGSKTGRSANFEEEGFKPPIYNVWTFSKKSNEVSHFGNSEQLDVGHRSVHAHVGLKRTVRTPKKKGKPVKTRPFCFYSRLRLSRAPVLLPVPRPPRAVSRRRPASS